MKRILPCLLLLLAAGAVRATVPAERVHAREAFAERGFGIFVHWGVYAVWGKGEWYLSQSHMPLADYEAKAAEFNPTNFDARAWAKAFKGAGARYVTITSRHHDGTRSRSSRRPAPRRASRSASTIRSWTGGDRTIRAAPPRTTTTPTSPS